MASNNHLRLEAIGENPKVLSALIRIIQSRVTEVAKGVHGIGTLHSEMEGREGVMVAGVVCSDRKTRVKELIYAV